MNEVWIQLIVSGATVLAGGWAVIKYAISQTKKREEALLKHTETTQRTMLEYFEKKNGHLERISKDFTSTNRDVADALNNLTTKIEVLTAKQK